MKALVATIDESDGPGVSPLIVVVDELDRCRPSYAIKVLEEIKHFFEIPGVVFIIGLHGDQLSRSVRAVYGSEFDSDDYLRRFFTRTYVLREESVMGHFSFRTAGHPASPTDKEAGAFKSKNPDHFRYPHHAAHFAFTRWTNLYSPSNGHLKGDIVSGPVAEHFASRPYSRTKDDHSRALGVKDVSVLEHKDKHESPPNKFTHLDYWSLDEMERVPKLKVPEHIRELRDAIDLLFNDEEVRALARELSKSRKTDLAEESDTAD